MIKLTSIQVLQECWNWNLARVISKMLLSTSMHARRNLSFWKSEWLASGMSLIIGLLRSLAGRISWLNFLSISWVIFFSFHCSWPQNGVLVCYTTFPSSNRTITSPRFEKHTMLVFSDEPNQLLQMPEDSPLKFLWGWKCCSKDESVFDPGDRFCGADAHVGWHTDISIIFLTTW